jgi:hypothetical protein
MKTAGRTVRSSFPLLAGGVLALGLVLLLSAGAAQGAPGGDGGLQGRRRGE